MSLNKDVDKAFKLFQEKKHEQAGKMFDKLLADDSCPSWMKARVRQFQAMSQSALNKTVEDDTNSMGRISIHLNLGEYDEAVNLLSQLDVSEGTKAFLTSEIYIQQENREEAIVWLKKAIELDPDNIGYAFNSPSFAEHVKEEDFEFLKSDTEEETEEA